MVGQPRSQGPFSTSRNRERTLGTRLVVSDQPRSQDLSSTHLKGSEAPIMATVVAKVAATVNIYYLTGDTMLKN